MGSNRMWDNSSWPCHWCVDVCAPYTVQAPYSDKDTWLTVYRKVYINACFAVKGMSYFTHIQISAINNILKVGVRSLVGCV